MVSFASPKPKLVRAETDVSTPLKPPYISTPSINWKANSRDVSSVPSISKLG